MSDNIRIGLCDDNLLFLQSLSQFINETPGFEVVFSLPSAHSLPDNVEINKPDIILMDIDMPEITGITATNIIHKMYPEVHVLMLTVYEDDEKIFDAILAGASGYLLKKTPPENILTSIKEVLEGGASMSPLIVKKVMNHFNRSADAGNNYDLSKQEKKVLQYLVDGHSYKMIAADCNINIGTVRGHISNIYKKLHINSKSEAVAKALKERLM